MEHAGGVRDEARIFPLEGRAKFGEFDFMPRGAGLDTEGALYHVMVGGLERRSFYRIRTEKIWEAILRDVAEGGAECS